MLNKTRLKHIFSSLVFKQYASFLFFQIHRAGCQLLCLNAENGTAVFRAEKTRVKQKEPKQVNLQQLPFRNTVHEEFKNILAQTARSLIHFCLQAISSASRNLLWCGRFGLRFAIFNLRFCSGSNEDEILCAADRLQ